MAEASRGRSFTVDDGKFATLVFHWRHQPFGDFKVRLGNLLRQTGYAETFCQLLQFRFDGTCRNEYGPAEPRC